MENQQRSTFDVDSMLNQVGDFGPYQVLLLFLFSFINVISAFHYFGQTFINLVPEHRCNDAVPENATLVDVGVCTETFADHQKLVDRACTNKWDYDDIGFNTIVQQFDWVCQLEWIPTIGQSVFFVGSVVGSLSLGVVADHIGRLHVLVIANVLAFFGNTLTILSSNAVLFIISRFIAGCATDANFVMMYIIVMEYVRPSTRTMGLNLCIGVFYCLGCVAVPWVALYLRSWRPFLLVVAIPHLLVLTFYFLVPESAQWLISKRKLNEAIGCFKRIAKVNHKIVSVKAVESLKQYAEEHVAANPETHENIWGLLKTPKLRKKTLILTFKSMVMTLCYDAISRNINGLGYSPFVLFSVTSTTILPACLIILMIQDRVGRKALASFSLLVCGIISTTSGMVLAIQNPPDSTIIVTLAIIARLAINVAYNSGAQYAVELIPTVVRGQGVSAIHVVGYAASFFSPQLLYLGHIWKPLPNVVLGVLLVAGAVACLFLPETLNRTLPVTLKDGEEFGEDEKILQFSCCQTTITESTMELNANETTHYGLNEDNMRF